VRVVQIEALLSTRMLHLANEQPLHQGVLVWLLRIWPLLPFLVLSFLRHMLLVMLLMPWTYALWCMPGLVSALAVKDKAAVRLNLTGLILAIALLAAWLLPGGGLQMD
jgi:hypothetical protein